MATQQEIDEIVNEAMGKTGTPDPGAAGAGGDEVWLVHGKGEPVIEVLESFGGDLYFVTEKQQTDQGTEIFCYARLYAMPDCAEWGWNNWEGLQEAYGRNQIWKVPKHAWGNIRTYEDGLLVKTPTTSAYAETGPWPTIIFRDAETRRELRRWKDSRASTGEVRAERRKLAEHYDWEPERVEVERKMPGENENGDVEILMSHTWPLPEDKFIDKDSGDERRKWDYMAIAQAGTYGGGWERWHKDHPPSKFTTTTYDKNFEANFYRLKEGGIAIDKRTVPDDKIVTYVFNSPMPDPLFPIGKKDRPPEPSDVMLAGLEGSYKTMAQMMKAVPDFTGMMRVSVPEYAAWWLDKGARVGVRQGDKIVWTDGTTSPIE